MFERSANNLCLPTGKTDLGRFATDSSLRTELMVEVETTDDEYYFAIFKVASLQPIEVKGYFLGNAGELIVIIVIITYITGQ